MLTEAISCGLIGNQMKNIFLGTHLQEADHREFGIIAATKGTSKSGLLKSIALTFLARHRKTTAKKKGLSV